MMNYGDAGVSQRTNVYAEAAMLMHARPVMILEKFGKPYKMPKNKSDTVRFRRPVPFAAQTVPLAEGITPSAVSMTFEDVSATLRQYGMWTQFSDKIEDTHEDPVVQEIARQQGENLGRTLEALNWAVVRAGTNVFYSNGSARSSVNTPISLNNQRAVTRALKAQKAMKIGAMIAPANEFGTRAVERSYYAVAHTNLESDIRNLPGFLPTAAYGQRRVICEEEIGAVEDVRYVLSPDLDEFRAAGSATLNGMTSVGGSNVDVYPVVYFGQDAWSYVALRGQGAVEPTIIPADRKTKDDPLGQRGVAGWKTWHAALILNQLWMARLEVAATQL